jgi:hypothetical protein
LTHRSYFLPVPLGHYLFLAFTLFLIHFEIDAMAAKNAADKFAQELKADE